MQILANNGSATDATLVEKASKLQDAAGISEEAFKVSSGWLNNFKRRYNLRCYQRHGEAAAANMEGVEIARKVLPNLLAGYSAKVRWLLLCCAAAAPNCSKSTVEVQWL